MQYSLNRTRNVRSTAGDVFPLFHRVRGHEVEDGANVLGGGEAMLLRSASSQPDSWISRSKPSRSRMASRVTASTSSDGSRPARHPRPILWPPHAPQPPRQASSPGIPFRVPASPAWWRSWD